MSRTAQRTNVRRTDVAVVTQRRRARLRRVVQIMGMALALAATAGGGMLLNDTFRVTSWDIEVGENAPATLHAQIDKAMQSLPSYDFWSTRPSALRRQLLADIADLENIEIRRTLSGSLFLKGIARRPVALWQNGEGKIRLIDVHGNAYRPLAQGELADLPLLRVAEGDIREASDLIHSLQAAEPEFYAAISELLSDGNSWTINFNRGQQWIVPRSRNISYAINRVGTLLDTPRWRSGHWRVDARMEARWYIRPARQEGVI